MSAEVYEWVRNKELDSYECELQDVSHVIKKRAQGEWMCGTRQFAESELNWTGPFKTLKQAKAECGDMNDTVPVGFENINEEFTRADRNAAKMAPGMAPSLYWQLFNMAKSKNEPVPIFKSAKAAQYSGQFMHPDGVIRPAPESPTFEEAMDRNGAIKVENRTYWAAVALTAVASAIVTSMGWLFFSAQYWA